MNCRSQLIKWYILQSVHTFSHMPDVKTVFDIWLIFSQVFPNAKVTVRHNRLHRHFPPLQLCQCALESLQLHCHWATSFISLKNIIFIIGKRMYHVPLKIEIIFVFILLWLSISNKHNSRYSYTYLHKLYADYKARHHVYHAIAQELGKVSCRIIPAITSKFALLVTSHLSVHLILFPFPNL